MFENGDFFILYVSWPEYAKDLIKKIYPTGHVKKKIGYFPTLGGEGGSPTKLENSNFFFLNPSLTQIFPNSWIAQVLECKNVVVCQVMTKSADYRKLHKTSF